MNISSIPKPAHVDITGRLLLQECADLLQLRAARAGVVEQVGELAGAGFDFLDIFLEFGIALENEDLVFRAALLRERVYRVY